MEGDTVIVKERKRIRVPRTLEERTLANEAFTEKINFKFGKALSSIAKEDRDKAVQTATEWLAKQYNMNNRTSLAMWKSFWMCYWLSDKPLIQQELAINLAQLIHKCPDKIGEVYARGFWRILAEQWHSIDRYRVDKYYMLMRHCLKEWFIWMKNHNWSAKSLETFSSVLLDDVYLGKDLGNLGVKIQIPEIIIDELYNATEGVLPAHALTGIISPMVEAIKKVDHKVIVQRIMNRCFDELLFNYVKPPADYEPEEDEEPRKYFEEIDYRGIEKVLHEAALVPGLPDLNRQVLYAIRDDFKKQADFLEGTYEDSEDEMQVEPAEEKKKKKPRKRAAPEPADEEEEYEEVIPAPPPKKIAVQFTEYPMRSVSGARPKFALANPKVIVYEKTKKPKKKKKSAQASAESTQSPNQATESSPKTSEESPKVSESDKKTPEVPKKNSNAKKTPEAPANTPITPEQAVTPPEPSKGAKDLSKGVSEAFAAPTQRAKKVAKKSPEDTEIVATGSFKTPPGTPNSLAGLTASAKRRVIWTKNQYQEHVESFNIAPESPAITNKDKTPRSILKRKETTTTTTSVAFTISPANTPVKSNNKEEIAVDSPAMNGKKKSVKKGSK